VTKDLYLHHAALFRWRRAAVEVVVVLEGTLTRRLSENGIVSQLIVVFK
jgi:hypothetical protein